MVYYVSLIINLIFCTYLANSYFLVNLFLQHFVVVESFVTQCCLWHTFTQFQGSPFYQLTAPLPQTLLSKAFENIVLYLETKFDWVCFWCSRCSSVHFIAVTSYHTTGRACCHTCSLGCSALSVMPGCFHCLWVTRVSYLDWQLSWRGSPSDFCQWWNSFEHPVIILLFSGINQGKIVWAIWIHTNSSPKSTGVFIV